MNKTQAHPTVTPGPWSAFKAAGAYPNCDRPNPGHHVNILFGADDDGGPVVLARFTDYRSDADARLIAAAPDLLASLRQVLDYYASAMLALHQTAGAFDASREVIAARAAIAKAEGV